VDAVEAVDSWSARELAHAPGAGLFMQLTERSGDRRVAVRGRVLVDQRCVRAAVAQPGHQLLRRGTGDGRQGCGEMAQVVEAHARQPQVGPGRDPVTLKVAPRQVSTASTGEQQRVGPRCLPSLHVTLKRR